MADPAGLQEKTEGLLDCNHKEVWIRDCEEVQGWFKNSSVSSSVSRFRPAGQTGDSTSGGSLHVNTKMF